MGEGGKCQNIVFHVQGMATPCSVDQKATSFLSKLSYPQQNNGERNPSTPIDADNDGPLHDDGPSTETGELDAATSSPDFGDSYLRR